MAKKKNYYVVRKGRKTGIFESWSECQEQINGYPGADFKGFETREEAERYFNGEAEQDEIGGDEEFVKPISSEDAIDKNFHIDAYVDGSYSGDEVRYAFGCVILTPNGEVIRDSGSNNDPESLPLRNVAGEMLGAMYAVKFAINNGYKSISIYYDYEGIEKWVIKEWKAKNKLTMQYAEFMNNSQKEVLIRFHKVKAHSGNKYNEMADQLAKNALTNKSGIPKVKKGQYWFAVDDFSKEDLETIIDLVKEELGEDVVVISEDKDLETTYILTFSPHERVTIHLYNTGKLVVQGKPKKLFATLISYITQLVETDSIPDIFNDVYQLNVDKKCVETEYLTYLPNAHDKLPSKLCKTLHQAVYNLNITGDMYDATFIAQPVIRGIDGHLKNVVLKHALVPDASYIKDNGFNIFDKVREEQYVLKSTVTGVGLTRDITDYIGNCYSFYHRNRNVLSHWDDPTAPMDTTKLLTINEAHDLIKRSLKLVDDYYRICS